MGSARLIFNADPAKQAPGTWPEHQRRHAVTPLQSGDPPAHAAMIAAENFTGYAGASCSGFGSVVPNASAGVAQLSTRRGRWLSLAAVMLSSSWVNVDRSAFLCRYWRSSRLMFSLVPRCHGSK